MAIDGIPANPQIAEVQVAQFKDSETGAAGMTGAKKKTAISTIAYTGTGAPSTVPVYPNP